MDRAAGSQHQGVSRCTGEPEVDWYLSDQQNRNILGFTHAAHRISWHCPDRQAQSSPAWKISMTVLSVRSTVPPRWWRQNCKSFRKPVCRLLKLMHIRKNKSYLQEISKRSLLSCTFYKRKRMGREILTELAGHSGNHGAMSICPGQIQWGLKVSRFPKSPRFT